MVTDEALQRGAGPEVPLAVVRSSDSGLAIFIVAPLPLGQIGPPELPVRLAPAQLSDPLRLFAHCNLPSEDRRVAIPTLVGRFNPKPAQVCTEHSPYPIRKVTTPVAVAGGVAGGATAHERRHLVPRAQEAERIGVPPADHGRGRVTSSGQSGRLSPSGSRAESGNHERACHPSDSFGAGPPICSAAPAGSLAAREGQEWSSPTSIIRTAADTRATVLPMHHVALCQLP